jgi:hypothetical protein
MCLGFEAKANVFTSPLSPCLLFCPQPLAAVSSRPSSWPCTTPYQDRRSATAKAISKASDFGLVSLRATHHRRASSVNLNPDRHLTELHCHPAMPRFTIMDGIGEILSILFPPPKLIPRTLKPLRPPTPTPSPPAIDEIYRAPPPSAVSQRSPAF